MQTLTEVLVECVAAAGGAKVVGAKLFPDLLIDQAQRKLLDCLNDDRPHNLTPDKVLQVALLARQAGCHAYMEHCARRLHYATPVPREPQQELAELQRAFHASLSEQAAMLQRIEALMGSLPPGSTGLKAVA
ncbi:hypothetical protein PEC18_05045 [Paucibacter sp. O1-1]|uniref:hypothetical protein n=1 Tax=Aquabacterium sp. OR-4 TaxID=2978127 RepID=UPI0021B446F7|nr:hypothetical protein [Aquabacterium sp. OR-4]MCU7370251.1 hypothetical protein [Paucibacter sp. O1-1]MDA3825236.1 hypothetical protein [Paucibacter sp. O1-1]MDT7836476.1 hypothetical protein [Aquabacterium sp. OR-4]